MTKQKIVPFRGSKELSVLLSDLAKNNDGYRNRSDLIVQSILYYLEHNMHLLASRGKMELPLEIQRAKENGQFIKLYEYIESMILREIAKAIKKSGKSCYQIAKDTGIDNAVLSRIMNDGSCSIKTADKLCEYLGLELRFYGKK